MVDNHPRTIQRGSLAVLLELVDDELAPTEHRGPPR